MPQSATLHQVPTAPSPAGLPPGPVRAAFALWVTAVAAGAFETVLAIGRMLADGTGSAGEIAVGLAIRLPVFVAALLIVRQMRTGRDWARIVLAIGLGVVGTASMVVGPVQALAHGRSLGWELAHATPLDFVFAASRTVHVSSVLAAVVLMFLPAANGYFPRGRLGRRDRRG
ncbi:hypothetical protein [Streptacidiphilus fuscans]|uniref:Uncharacterized protein n=1 Tax=Streptacidiphilus fuscans TaxID=2789292 RepID=A0A931B2W4_9ACTN|nr:hypothetical protein [Streptacidiphilus fuscans]MBF9069369.1 hypothetical protein [Streptacidiphilus fuscans]